MSSLVACFEELEQSSEGSILMDVSFLPETSLTWSSCAHADKGENLRKRGVKSIYFVLSRDVASLMIENPGCQELVTLF